jgi:spore germination protein
MKNMNILKAPMRTIAPLIVLMFVIECAWLPRDNWQNSRRYDFREIWGYLMKGEEQEVTGREPFTDILYFGAGVNKEGKLTGTIEPPALPHHGTKPRIHLVVFILSDPALLHRCLNKKGPARGALISDIAAAADDYDGIQIDFESLLPEDGKAFHDFLANLKRKMPDKILSAAVPVRLNGNGKEKKAYDYESLSGILDKIVVMAYDQHWRTSNAGPVASLSWCDVAADYAVASIPRDKLVMGIPLYGRAWQDEKLNRAVTYRQARELSERSVKRAECIEKGPYFEYTEKVTVRVFYEDIGSIHAKMKLYDSYRIPSVAFWRIGQGPKELWNTIVIPDQARHPAAVGTSASMPQHRGPE